MGKQRVYICASARFPRGDAGANRILYMAKALQSPEREVVILSYGSKEGTVEEGRTYGTYEGILYRSLDIYDTVSVKLLSGYLMTSLLKKCGVKKGDVVYLYGSNSTFVAPLLRFCKRRGIRCVIDVVEWHQPFQYPKGERDLRYRSSNTTFTKLSPRTNGVISISECIAQYYRNKNVITEVFPVIIDANEHSCDLLKKQSDDFVHLIYPGNPMYKDDIAVMLEGIAELNADEKHRLRMHLSGVSEAKLRSYLGDKEKVLDTLGETVVFHGWLEYADLISLYEKVHFLYMSRPDNLVTRANFPSKMPELMTYGIIPVGNRVGDYPNYLEDGKDSVLFDQNTKEDCANALRRVLLLSTEERMEMHRAVLQTVSEKFDYHNWKEKVQAFMERI